MKRKLDQMDLGEENNTGSSPRGPLGEKWYITINNWTQRDWDQMDQILEERKDEIILAAMGKEVGESGTPHLQIYISCKKRIRRQSKIFKSLDCKPHWGSEVRGKKGQPCSKHMPDAIGINYCSKDGDYKLYRCRKPRDLKLIEPRGWQVPIVELVQEEPDDRTIHWLHEPTGGTGKTSLCKYLVVNHKAIILGGKAADIRQGVLMYAEKNGVTPDLIVVNLTRSQEERVSYEGLENIKDMCFYSGKYEGGMVVGPCPHLIVFANFAPAYEKMSQDRWVVTEILPDIDMI